MQGRRGGRLKLALPAVAAGLCVAGLAAAVGARPYALAMVSRRLGRPVHVDGALSVRPGFDGLSVRFSRLHVDQPAWAGRGAMVWIDRGLAVLPWTVLVGDSRVSELQLDGLRLALRRDAGGRANWAGDGSGKAPRPPRLGRLVLRSGILDYQDLGRALTFRGALDATTPPSGVPVLRIDGDGRSEGSPWSAHFRTTTDVTDAAPYALSLRLRVDKPDGGSTADFQGRLTPREDGRLEGRLDAEGPDLHDLSHLINVPLPHTPTYRLQAQLAASDKAIRLQQLAGRIGASDVAGALTITPDPAGRRLEGDVRSRSLRMSDLFAVISGGQLTSGHRSAGRFLPDAAINAAPLRKLTGRIGFRAAHVQSPTPLDIRSLQLDATFDRGRVGAEPMVLQLAHGRAVIRFVLDARAGVRAGAPRIRLDAALTHADTADFGRPGGAPAPLRASFDGEVHLAGSGASLSQAAAHASGTLSLHALDGRLQRVQAAVLSANLSRGLIALLTKTDDDVPVQCAEARFQVSDGQARATNLRMATALGGVVGYGGFNLGSEIVDLTLRPASPGGLDVSSVRIDGPLTHPRATLALDNPTGMVRHALTRLLHPAAGPPRSTAGCGPR